MQCLHCGKRLTLVKRLAKDEFCSKAHEEAYEREYNLRALNRMLQGNLPPEEPKPAPAAQVAPISDAPRVSNDPPLVGPFVRPFGGLAPLSMALQTPDGNAAEVSNDSSASFPGFSQTPGARLGVPRLEIPMSGSLSLDTSVISPPPSVPEGKATALLFLHEDVQPQLAPAAEVAPNSDAARGSNILPLGGPFVRPFGGLAPFPMPVSSPDANASQVSNDSSASFPGSQTPVAHLDLPRLDIPLSGALSLDTPAISPPPSVPEGKATALSFLHEDVQPTIDHQVATRVLELISTGAAPDLGQALAAVAIEAVRAASKPSVPWEQRVNATPQETRGETRENVPPASPPTASPDAAPNLSPQSSSGGQPAGPTPSLPPESVPETKPVSLSAQGLALPGIATGHGPRNTAKPQKEQTPQKLSASSGSRGTEPELSQTPPAVAIEVVRAASKPSVPWEQRVIQEAQGETPENAPPPSPPTASPDAAPDVAPQSSSSAQPAAPTPSLPPENVPETKAVSVSAKELTLPGNSKGHVVKNTAKPQKARTPQKLLAASNFHEILRLPIGGKGESIMDNVNNMGNVFAETFIFLREEMRAELLPKIASEVAAVEANLATEIQEVYSRTHSITAQLEALNKLILESSRETREAQQRSADELPALESRINAAQSDILAKVGTNLKAQRDALMAQFQTELQTADRRSVERTNLVSERIAELRERISTDSEAAERARNELASMIDQDQVSSRLDLMNEVNAKLENVFGDLDRRVTERIVGIEKKVLSMEQDFMAKLGAGLQSNQASLTSAMSIELQALEKRNLKRIEALSKDIPELIRAELAPKLANHGERISMQEGRLATIKNFVENLEATSDDRIRGIGAKLTTEIERLENHFSSELDSRIMNTREYASRSFAESAEREKQLQEGLANLRTALQDTRSTMSREFEEQLDTRIHDIGQESTNRMLDLVMGLGNVCETAASRLTIPAGQPAKLPNQQSDIPTTETDAKAQRLIPGVSSQQESVPEKITTPASPDDNGSKVTKWRNIRTLFQTTGAKSGQ